MKPSFYAVVALLGVLSSGCGESKTTLSGVYKTANKVEGNVSGKQIKLGFDEEYDFRADGTIKYKSEMKGAITGSSTGKGNYTIKDGVVDTKVTVTNNQTNATYDQSNKFKIEGNDLIQIGDGESRLSKQ